MIADSIPSPDVFGGGGLGGGQQAFAAKLQTSARGGRMIDPERDRVLITGAAGAIGTTLRQGLRERYRHLRLMDIRLIADVARNEEWIQGDVADAAKLDTAMAGITGLI